MEDIENVKLTGPGNQIPFYKSRPLYGALKKLEVLLQDLKPFEGLLRDRVEVLPSMEPTLCPDAVEKPVRTSVDVEEVLEEKRKMALERMGKDNLKVQEINFNDIRFLSWNEVHNQMYSDIKQEIVSEAIRVLHLSSEGESNKQNDDKDDLSTSVTDEFVSLLAEAYKDNSDFHFISCMTFNQLLQSSDDMLGSTAKVNNPRWEKIFADVYHSKHFYGCIAHVKKRKFYIVDSCRLVSVDSYRSTVAVLLTYLNRTLKLSMDNWTINIVNNYPQWHIDRKCGVFMCKCFQYWARGEKLPLDEKNIVAARLILLYEVRKRELADERMWDSQLKRCVACEKLDALGGIMESSSSSSSIIPFEGSTKIILKLAQPLDPQKENDNQLNQTTQVDIRKLQPEWLEKFFKRTFFDPCSEHPIRRNELNKYCIDCDVSLCQYCVSLASHTEHRILKIYRHVYKDVVPLDEIEQHIDCSQIQPYRCNKQLVIALTPLPHSGAKTNDEATCQTCKRKLIEYDLYNYCSISCKVEAFSKKENDSAPPFLLLDSLDAQERVLKKPTVDHLTRKVKQDSELQSTLDQQEPEPKKINRKRKGVPRRAPLS